MTTAATGVVVVGGGIVGAACALALTEDGWTVTLVEANAIGRATTAAGMGHIVTLDGSEAILALTRLSVDAWRQVAPTLPPEVGWSPTGTLWIADREEVAVVLRERSRRLARTGADAALLTVSEVRELEPHLVLPGGCGLWVRDDAVLDAPRAAVHFAEAARAKGTSVRERSRAIRVTGHSVSLDDGSTLKSEAVVVAVGPSAADLVPGVPVRPRKGHLVRLRVPSGFLSHQVTEAGYGASDTFRQPVSVAFTAQPRPDGTILLGASRQNGTEDPSVEPGVVELLYERAERFLPEVRSLEVVETRTGFRPATPDDLPLIGRWPVEEDLFLAVGHEGFGVTTAVGTANLVRDLLARRSTAISTRPFEPGRFSPAA